LTEAVWPPCCLDDQLLACHPSMSRGTPLPFVLAGVRLCRRVSLDLVGKLSAVLPLQKLCAGRHSTRNRPEQEKRGAPGWNRTSDTRFGNHAEGVTGRGGSCAIVLHGPRFCASSVLGRAQPCCAVARRLVGIAAATPRRPRRQSRAAHGNRGALAPRPAHARLRRAAYPGGPFEDGDHPLPEVLPGT